MTSMTRNEDVNGHLRPEEIDLCIESDGAWGRSVWLHEHLRVCERCLREIAFVESLDRRLVGLPHLKPSPGFSGRVMARVDLPVPWYARAWEIVRARWIVFAATAAASLAVAGGAFYWLFVQAGATPAGLASFVFDGIGALVMKGLIAGGRALYGLGLIDAGGGLLEGGGSTQALSALALLGTLSLMSLLAMTRLVRGDGAPVARVARR